ncbi:MAG: TonB-dependent receptor, partial [Gammaproteobacteria bacterium]|nr:TonB-dependent receptor [Gammaproteobacteria bacterium]
MAGRLCSVRGACVGLAVVTFASATWAQSASEGGVIEEVIVTAQRIAEGMQDVPIPVTALTGEMLEEEQVITPSDLQMNAPNVSFTATNFGGSSFSIRGIGNLVVANSGQSGVSTHINEVSVVSNLNSIEFFDMERVEILRGPQGTLFGRNATGGAVNFVTQMPKQGIFEGFVDVETGDYAHTRLKAAVNVPLADTAALRLAGYRLTRDGYIENLAFGQTDFAGRRLPGIDGDVDGRDVLALRGTLSWEITDRAGAWLQFHMLDEDDDRVRISNQVCVRNSIPTNGCLADGFGFDTPHFGATTAGIFAGGVGALPLGTNGSEAALLDFPRPD